MHKSLDQALSFSNRWLDLIKNPVVNEEQGKQIIEESTSNFAEHFNRGWLDFRQPAGMLYGGPVYHVPTVMPAQWKSSSTSAARSASISPPC